MREDVSRGLLKAFALARGYQRSIAREAARRGRVLITLPTGAGKTIIGSLLAGIFASIGEGPVLVLVPTTILQEQWVNTLRTLYGNFSVNTDPEVVAPITVLTYSMAGRYAGELAGIYKSIIIDEAHHVRPDSYQALKPLIDKAKNVVGMTATPEKMDKAVKEMYSKVVGRGLGELAGRYLVPPRITAVEWSGTSLLDAPPDVVADAVRQALADGARKIIVFAAQVGKAEEIADALQDLGIPVYRLYGTSYMTRNMQKQILNEYNAVDKAVLVVSPVGDEGMDIPSSDTAIIATPSMVTRRMIQRIGRVLRPAPGKTEAKVYILVPSNHPAKDKLLEQVRSIIPEDVEFDPSILENLYRTEARIRSRLETLDKVLPELTNKTAEIVADTILGGHNKKVDDVDEKLALIDYMWHYYLNLYGDPSRALRAMKRDVATRGAYISLQRWLLNPAAGDIPGIDDASHEAKMLLQRLLSSAKLAVRA